MSDFNDYLEAKQNDMLQGLNTCAICRIKKIYYDKMKVDVTPLFDSGLTLILDCPLGFHQNNKFMIRVPYEPGDLVVVVFSQRDIDSIMYGGGDQATRTHGIEDAIVVGGVQPYTEPITKEHVKDVVVTDKRFKNKFVIKDNGEIFVESMENINILSQKDVIIRGQNIYLN